MCNASAHGRSVAWRVTCYASLHDVSMPHPTPPHPTPVQPVDTTPKYCTYEKYGDIKIRHTLTGRRINRLPKTTIHSLRLPACTSVASASSQRRWTFTKSGEFSGRQMAVENCGLRSGLTIKKYLIIKNSDWIKNRLNHQNMVTWARKQWLNQQELSDWNGSKNIQDLTHKIVLCSSLKQQMFTSNQQHWDLPLQMGAGPAIGERLLLQDLLMEKPALKLHQNCWSWIEPIHLIWANYNNSLTWIKAIWGWFPLLTMIYPDMMLEKKARPVS